MIYAFFYFFAQMSFSTKNYFLIAVINLTTRGPLYTCLVFLILAKIFNNFIGSFAAESKLADILDIFKSIDSTDRRNCRPINILRLVSKFFEKLIHNRLSPFFANYLANIYVAIKKATLHHTLSIDWLKTWKKFRDDNAVSSAVLMDLSNVLDTINHDLL